MGQAKLHEQTRLPEAFISTAEHLLCVVRKKGPWPGSAGFLCEGQGLLLHLLYTPGSIVVALGALHFLLGKQIRSFLFCNEDMRFKERQLGSQPQVTISHLDSQVPSLWEGRRVGVALWYRTHLARTKSWLQSRHQNKKPNPESCPGLQPTPILKRSCDLPVCLS